MQEQNNFERQVRETMEGFSLPPSAPVWQKVEREIRRKKERRRLVLWLLPVLLAGGLWLLVTNVNQENKTSTASAPTTTEIPGQKTPEQTAPGKGPLAPVELRDSENADPSSSATGISSPTSISGQPDDIIAQNKTRATAKIANKNTNKSALTNRKTSVGQTPEIAAAVKPNDPARPTLPSLEGKSTDSSKTLKNIADPVLPATPAEEKTVQPVDPKPLTDEDTALAAPVAGPTPAAPRPRKWKISLQATGGYAQTMKSFFPLASSPENTTVPTSIGYSPRVSSAEPEPGAAISAGLLFTSTLSTRIKFNTGIQYSYASTQQPYGEKAIGSMNGVSPSSDSGAILLSTGNVFKFTNRYHFVEIPAGIDFRLFTTLPVDLHTGISISALLASNAVQFDDSYGLYYRQKENLQRIGVNAFAGFSYTLARQRLKIGPHLQYSLLPVHQGDGKRYMVTGGIRARMSLN